MHEKQVIEHAPISTHVRNKTENNCKMQFCVILRNKLTLTPFFKYICLFLNALRLYHKLILDLGCHVMEIYHLTHNMLPKVIFGREIIYISLYLAQVKM